MHDADAEGNDFFRCDFCRNSWAEDRPMVEGHKGSLICGPCLTVAYTEIILGGPGQQKVEGGLCTLCLADKDEPHWQSPAYVEAHICRWCIEHSAKMFDKDPGSGWKRPG